jgi:hypothetical protein
VSDDLRFRLWVSCNRNCLEQDLGASGAPFVWEMAVMSLSHGSLLMLHLHWLPLSALGLRGRLSRLSVDSDGESSLVVDDACAPIRWRVGCL